jgi:hypothetical protein
MPLDAQHGRHLAQLWGHSSLRAGGSIRHCVRQQHSAKWGNLGDRRSVRRQAPNWVDDPRPISGPFPTVRGPPSKFRHIYGTGRLGEGEGGAVSLGGMGECQV